MIRIGILSSHNGTGFLALQEAIEKKSLKAQVVLVISNNSNANVLTSAQEKNIPNFSINTKKCPNEDLDEKIVNLMDEFKCDYIFLSGYMKKIGTKIINKFENRIINSHPALLPKYGGKGMYGRYVHEAVIKEKENESGCTIHYVNENYDEGKYILQNKIFLSANETVDSLENKIKSLEAKSIVEAFSTIIEK